MINEISHVGLTPAQGSGRSIDVPALPPHSGRETSGDPVSATEQPLTSHAGFAALASVKDAAGDLALSLRLGQQSLVQAAALVQEMRQDAQTILKNYPPFPPGNEQRMNYLNSIVGLRRQLEALTFPPVESAAEPVYYPRLSDLPALDVNTASDQELQVFAQALDRSQEKLTAGLAALRAQARTGA